MSSSAENKPTQHLQTTYIFINAILFAPILLWPLPILIFDNPMLVDVIIPKWHLSIIILLIASVSMDSIMYGAKSLNQSISHALWIAAISLLIIQHQSDAWMLAVLFFIHSFRSAIHLFKMNHQTTSVRVAWVRDSLSAIVILAWSYNIT